MLAFSMNPHCASALQQRRHQRRRRRRHGGDDDGRIGLPRSPPPCLSGQQQVVKCAERPTASFRCEVAVASLASWPSSRHPGVGGARRVLRVRLLPAVDAKPISRACSACCASNPFSAWSPPLPPLGSRGWRSGAFSSACVARRAAPNRPRARELRRRDGLDAAPLLHVARLRQPDHRPPLQRGRRRLLRRAAHRYAETAAATAAAASGLDIYTKGLLLFGLLLIYCQLAVCTVASAFNGWKHLQHWAQTRVKPRQVAPTPEGGSSSIGAVDVTVEGGGSSSGGAADVTVNGLDPEHARLVHVG